jgi:hypothetical protein
MRRSGQIRERSPGAFELRYSLGTDPATGKRRIATVTLQGSRKEAAQLFSPTSWPGAFLSGTCSSPE